MALAHMGYHLVEIQEATVRIWKITHMMGIESAEKAARLGCGYCMIADYLEHTILCLYRNFTRAGVGWYIPGRSHEQRVLASLPELLGSSTPSGQGSMGQSGVEPLKWALDERWWPTTTTGGLK